MLKTSSIVAITLFFVNVLPARAQTGYPMITRVQPVAIQRGTTAEVTISSSGTTGGSGSFNGASAMLMQAPGLKGTVLTSETNVPDQAKAKGRGNRRATSILKANVTAASDTPPGPREIRVATPQGVSSVGLVVIVNDPVVSEIDDKLNDESKGAQLLALPGVVSGTIGKPEDVDWYAVAGKAGTRVVFSVWANRLENKIHDLQLHFDPILLLFDANGRELAADDNHDFADPLLSYEFKRDGTYFLQVRDTTYGGNLNWTYALQATSGPVATSVFPLAVNPGKTAKLHARGYNIDPEKTIALDVPEGAVSGPRLVSLPTEKGPSLASPVVVTELPIILESDDAPPELSKAQKVVLPAAICGRLNSLNDSDGFAFEAKKGGIYAFEVVARRAGAATDPVFKILNDKDAALAEADDTPGLGKDSRLEWTAPADGTFTIQISDLHSRGGDEFGYVILAEPAKPDFTLTCDPDKLNLGPGGRVPLFFQVTRRAGFVGPVTVDFGTLPAGVSASPLTIGPKLSQGVSVISARSDTKPRADFLSIQGKAENLVRNVSPRQEIYMPGGGRATYPVETLALGVTDPSDIAVEASPKTISLSPGGTATIEVTVTRNAGFEQGVNLAIVLEHLGGVHANPLPPGVSVRQAGSKTLLGPKETKGKIVLEAAANASPIENVPICVMGHVSINFVVKTAYASEPIGLSVMPK